MIKIDDEYDIREITYTNGPTERVIYHTPCNTMSSVYLVEYIKKYKDSFHSCHNCKKRLPQDIINKVAFIYG